MHSSRAIDQAYRRGDLPALKTLLGDPADFPNCRGFPGSGGVVLEYAIYHSPVSFIRTLLELGADPNYADDAGFPSLIAALSCSERRDRHEMLDLLLAFGADIQQRGCNDYTPLHYAANLEDIPAMQLLLERGADLQERTRIDECATPREEAELLGRKLSAEFLRQAEARTA